MGNLNNSWNGKTLHVERASSDSFTVEDPRLTVHLMLQPTIFQGAVQKKNNIWEESGLLARALFAVPESKIGSRTNETPYSSAYHGIDDFLERIKHLLDRGYAQPFSDTVEDIKFSQESAAIWNKYLFETEREMSAGGKYEAITATESKAAENVARIAALLQCFEDSKMDVVSRIRPENVLVAIEICNWYLLQQKNYFSPNLKHPGEKDAALLWRWIYRRAQPKGDFPLPALNVKLIAKTANPRFLRKAAVWQPALDFLEESRYLTSEYIGPEEYVVIAQGAPHPPDLHNWSRSPTTWG